jgi:cobyrinic acid a,c-diamide synthase
MTRALMIAAPNSNAGKTTVTLGLLAAFRTRGVRVRAAKAGPDYIDPAFHAAATGAPCVNLDSWAMPPDLLTALFADARQDTDLLVIEAAMGLFDGVTATAGACGRAADLAARFRLPVILVLNVSGQSQSAAATARGFMLHDPDVRIAGVILNRVGSARHAAGIKAALTERGITCFGALPRDPGLSLPERHLGLVQATEQSQTLPEHLRRLSRMVETHLDLDAIRAVASGDAGPTRPPTPPPPWMPPPGQRIAVAQDHAFSFLYPHVIQGWRAAGAELRFFSPLADEAPPADTDACWLPGGYPELHGATLAAADRFRTCLRGFARNRPVHGECGGYMVLGQAIVDADNRPHPMLGLLSHTTSFAVRRLHLGYRQARLLQDGVLGPAGSERRGHEFHYATLTDPGTDSALAILSDAAGQNLGPAGGRRGMVSGSFFHVMA